MNLKPLLKALKLNEPTISMILGALVVLAVGILVVNYFRGRESTPLPSGRITEEGKKVSLPVTHKVVAGEHLWGIAEKYYKSGYNWVDIAKENKLTNANLILVDQELVIPNIEAKTATVPKEAIASGKSTIGPPIGGDSYTVVKGDNLWTISVRAYSDGYKWTQVWQDNKAGIKNPNLIYPDQVLKLKR